MVIVIIDLENNTGCIFFPCFSVEDNDDDTCCQRHLSGTYQKQSHNGENSFPSSSSQRSDTVNHVEWLIHDTVCDFCSGSWSINVCGPTLAIPCPHYLKVQQATEQVTACQVLQTSSSAISCLFFFLPPRLPPRLTTLITPWGNIGYTLHCTVCWLRPSAPVSSVCGSGLKDH